MTLSSVCLLAVLAAGPADAGVSEAEKAEGFVSLFNGKDLTGWHITHGPDKSFRVRDGLLECTGAGEYPNWLRSDKVYENFVLRFDFNLPHYAESGLLISAPPHGRCSKVGFKIQLCDHVAHGHKTAYSGAIMGVLPAVGVATKNYIEWNTVEVIMDWPRLQVTINGRLVQQVDCTDHEVLRYRLRSGYLGLQDMGSRTSYRNLRIKELPSKEKWTSLFDGKSFDGWTKIGAAKWEIRDGVIRASDGNGYVLTENKYEDFELHAYVRTSRYANGGIFLRWKSWEPRDRGYEIQVANDPDGANPTGSIYGWVRAHILTARDGEWFPMHIIAKGPKVVVRVNGELCAASDKLDLVRSGHIALQMHRRNSWIEFKDIRIKDAR